MLKNELLLAGMDYKAWTNPHINNNGTMGGNTFACTCTGDYRATNSNDEDGGVWRCFDGNEQTTYFNRCGSGAAPAYLSISFYNPKPILLTNISIVQAYYGFNSSRLQYSDDGQSWVKVVEVSKGDNDIPDVGLHRYWKLANIYGVTSGGWRNVQVYEIRLNGFEKC